MLYTKPVNKTYVQLAIEFDNEFYTENRDDNKLYKYMYLLYYMLACKKKYFPNTKDYEDYDAYAQFAATTIYVRFIKKEKRGEKIKSVLNYIKSTLYSLKVMYQQDTFSIIFDEFKPGYNPDAFRNAMTEYVQNDYNKGQTEDILESFELIPAVIERVLLTTPYKSDKLMLERLYLSCLLTLLNNFTFTTQQKENLKTTKKETDAVMLSNIEKEKKQAAILWHLDSKLKDYVLVLNNRIKAELSKDIEDIRQTYILEDDVIDSILNSVYNNYEDIVCEEEY